MFYDTVFLMVVAEERFFAFDGDRGGTKDLLSFVVNIYGAWRFAWSVMQSNVFQGLGALMTTFHSW